MQRDDTQTRLEDLERQLERCHVEWQSTFDAITDWISIIDLNFRILRSNQSSKALLGLDPRNVVGRTCYELVHGTMEHITGCPIPKMLETGKRGESELCLPDGRWIMVTADPMINDQGIITGAVHMVRDITKRKLIEVALRENQERLSLAAETAFLGLWDWRIDLNRLFPNQIFLEMTGMNPEDTRNFSRETWLNRVHPEDRPSADQAISAHLAGETPKAVIECRVKHPQKGWIWLAWARSLNATAGAKPSAWWGFTGISPPMCM